MNNFIRADEVRVIDHKNENIGVMKLRDAVKMATDIGLDLVEISDKADPPIARIVEYGKFLYEEKKKQKEAKANQKVIETKTIQIKVGTSGDIVKMRANKICKWLGEGNNVKVDLFLQGRYKYMEKAFLEDRLNKFLETVPCPFTRVGEIQKSQQKYSLLLNPKK